jgi:hypothetical protein
MTKVQENVPSDIANDSDDDDEDHDNIPLKPKKTPAFFRSDATFDSRYDWAIQPHEGCSTFFTIMIDEAEITSLIDVLGDDLTHIQQTVESPSDITSLPTYPNDGDYFMVSAVDKAFSDFITLSHTHLEELVRNITHDTFFSLLTTLIPIRTNLYRIPKPFTHSNAWHFPTV